MTMLAFELAFEYRNPVIVAGDGYLGQITGKVTLPDQMIHPGLPEWAVYGDHDHRGNLVASIQITEQDLERKNIHLNEKYYKMQRHEQRADQYYCDDAEIVIIAANTPAQMAKAAVQQLRELDIPVGLYRPQTLWPFPIDPLMKLMPNIRDIIVVTRTTA